MVRCYLIIAPPAGMTIQPRLPQPREAFHSCAECWLKPIPIHPFRKAGWFVRVRTTKKDALAFAAQIETTWQVDRQRVNMLRGGRSRHINYASHRLDWYLQPGSLCDFTSPGPGSVYEVLS